MMFESTVGIRFEARELDGAACASAAISELLSAPQNATTSARLWSGVVVEDFMASGGRCLAIFTDERTPKVGPVGVAFYRGGDIEQMAVSEIASEGTVEPVLIQALLERVAGQGWRKACLHVDVGESSTRWERIFRAAGFEDAGDRNWMSAPLKPTVAA